MAERIPLYPESAVPTEFVSDEPLRILVPYGRSDEVSLILGDKQVALDETQIRIIADACFKIIPSDDNEDLPRQIDSVPLEYTLFVGAIPAVRSAPDGLQTQADHMDPSHLLWLKGRVADDFSNKLTISEEPPILTEKVSA